MPRIIENLKERLMAEANRQVRESGYQAMTVRSVAAACGIGVGTVYNYFPSKDALLAACMLEDWNRCIGAIRAAASEALSPEPVARCVFDELRGFSRAHAALFEDESAQSGFAAVYRRYHALLREQLAEPFRPFCESALAASFVSEALLSWTLEGIEFEQLYSLLQRLFEKGENKYVQL